MKSKVSRTQPVKIQDFVSNHIHQTITNWENLQSLLASLLVPKPLNNEQETLKIEGPIDSILIRGNFPDEQLMQLHSSHVTPWFADFVNFIIESILPPHASRSEIDKLKSDAKYYVGDDPYLWRFGSDQVIRRCVLDHEIQFIL